MGVGAMRGLAVCFGGCWRLRRGYLGNCERGAPHMMCWGFGAGENLGEGGIGHGFDGVWAGAFDAWRCGFWWWILWGLEPPAGIFGQL